MQHPCSLLSAAPAPLQRSAALQDFQSKELPTTRIQPDRRWFGNTRVIGQKQLEAFREEMGAKVGGREGQGGADWVGRVGRGRCRLLNVL